jgi:hypothetical protein
MWELGEILKRFVIIIDMTLGILLVAFGWWLRGRYDKRVEIKHITDVRDIKQ